MLSFEQYKEALSRVSFGKRLNNVLYVGTEALLNSVPEFKNFLLKISFAAGANETYNVVKLFINEFRVSLLYYEDLFKVPHPVLLHSTTINLSTGKVRNFDYADSDNPPILHRKELLIKPGLPSLKRFEALTRAEESFGLYDNPKAIGFKKSWEKILAEKGLAYQGHKLVIIGKTKSVRGLSTSKVKRHKTAITRYSFSKPIQTLQEYGILQDTTSLFDYGCGKGQDVEGLKKLGYVTSGWDPVFRSSEKKREADIVNLGFVLNVIENSAERIEVLRDAYGLSKRLLVVSSMISSNSANNTAGRPYNDGVLTQRGTFQKYFEQTELGQFIEDVLDTPAIAIGPGIYYVFKDQKDHHDFLVNRTKRKINWDEISSKLFPGRAKVLRQKDLLYEQNKELVDEFWEVMLELGRLPTQEEFPRAEELKSKFGTPKSANKYFVSKYGAETLKTAFESRRNDLLVYLALSNFKRKVPFRDLSSKLQIDIKTFLGSYSAGLEESKKLLFSIGNSDIITKLCEQTSFGHNDHKAFFLHKNLIDELHPVLRIYVGCSSVLYGDIKDADVIKIHKKSGKVTLLKYDEFENKNLPELKERIKIDLRNQKVHFFNYEKIPQIQLLYFKHRYVREDHPKKQKWIKFSHKLKKTGIDFKIGYGPTKQELLEMLNKQGLTLNLNRKRLA